MTCSAGTYQAGPPLNSGLVPPSPGWKETRLDAPDLASLTFSQPFLGTLKQSSSAHPLLSLPSP